MSGMRLSETGCQFLGLRVLGLQKEELVVGLLHLYCSTGSRLVNDVMNKETTTYDQGLLDP